MSNPTDRVEISTSVQRRRRWTASEKVRIVEETFEPGVKSWFGATPCRRATKLTVMSVVVRFNKLEGKDRKANGSSVLLASQTRFSYPPFSEATHERSSVAL
jgi:hypothetical protein